MTNIFFEDEKITKNDLYFVCYMIERISRKIHQKNKHVVNSIPKDEWIKEFHLQEGNFDISNVDYDMTDHIPSATQMGKVYARLISDTQQPGEDYIDALLRVYNDEICDIIDNYNCSAYYEPSYVIARAYQNGGF